MPFVFSSSRRSSSVSPSVLDHLQIHEFFPGQNRHPRNVSYPAQPTGYRNKKDTPRATIKKDRKKTVSGLFRTSTKKSFLSAFFFIPFTYHSMVFHGYGGVRFCTFPILFPFLIRINPVCHRRSGPELMGDDDITVIPRSRHMS